MAEVITARATGASHRHNGTPCQDATAYAVTDRTAVLAVGDGRPLSELAHQGAEAACRAAVRVGVEHAERLGADAFDAAHAAIEAARDAVLARATQLDVDAWSLATSLSLAVVTSRAVVVAGIGDGVHVLRDRQGALALPAMAPARATARDAYTLLQSDYRHRLMLARSARDDVDGIILSTSGLRRALLQGSAEDPFPLPGLAHGLLDANRMTRWRQIDYQRLAVSLTQDGRTDDDIGFAVARVSDEDDGLTVTMLSGRTVRLGRLADEGLRHSWRLADLPGLKLARLDRPVSVGRLIGALVDPPDAWTEPSPSPHLAWPLDAAVDHEGMVFGLLVRPAIGQSLSELPLAGHAHAATVTLGVEAAVQSLHRLGYAHGQLHMGDFIVGPRDHVQLRDLRPALTETRHLARRRLRDQRFVRQLRSALHYRAGHALSSHLNQAGA